MAAIDPEPAPPVEPGAEPKPEPKPRDLEKTYGGPPKPGEPGLF